MIARKVSKPNICRLRILHCLCQHWGNVSAPGIFCDPCPTGGLLLLICWAILYGFAPWPPRHQLMFCFGMRMDLLVPEVISLISKLGAMMVLIKAGFMSLCHSLEERMVL